MLKSFYPPAATCASESFSGSAPMLPTRPARPAASRFFLLAAWCLLALPKVAAAQAPPPAWELAQSATNSPGTNNTSTISAAAVDARGNVFVTGHFEGSVAFGGTQLTSAGSSDVFVAKWDAVASAFTWATSGGGSGIDEGRGIAVNGPNVYVTGNMGSNGVTRIAGQTLTGAGGYDLFVAKYVDTSTGSTPAISSFANAWATSGGGTSNDMGSGIAVNGAGVFVTGYFSSAAAATIAGQALAGAGSTDLFVAKYVDTSTGSTPATSSVANAWATSGGGGGYDAGQGIAVRGANVYVTGSFTSGGSARIAGQTLAGAGSFDLFVAKYVDTSTGSTPATSSFANAWVASGGGPGSDVGYAVALSGQRVYATGKAVPPAVFGGVALASAGSGQSALLARLTDPALPLAAAPAASVGARLALYPNPFPGGTATLTGAAPGGAVTVVDALGRAVASARADAAGTAALALPAGLPAGVYLVRAGTQALRLAVE